MSVHGVEISAYLTNKIIGAVEEILDGTIEVFDDDGEWIAHVSVMPGVRVRGSTERQARERAMALCISAVLGHLSDESYDEYWGE